MRVAERPAETTAERPTAGLASPRRHRPAWLWDGLGGAGLLVLAVVLNWEAVVRHRYMPASGPGSDFWLSHWSNAAYLKETTASATGIPLWNWQIMSGRPFAGDPLVALSYPPTHLVHFFELTTYFLILMIGHLALAGLGAYALARWGARLGPLAAFATGVAFMWSPRLIGHYGAGHLTMEMSAAWMPWVALGLVLAVREHAIWAAFAGLALGMLVLAGHPQIAFYTALMIGGLGLGALVWAVTRPGGPRLRAMAALRVLGLFAVAGVIGGLVGSALILPALEFANQSLREQGLELTDRIAVTDFLAHLLWVPFHLDLPHERTFAPGLVALLLIPLALWRSPALGAALLAGVGGVAVLAVGAATPVAPFLAEHLPGFAYFRAPARVWFLATLALALLAGLGLQALWDGLPRRRWLPALLAVLLVANLWLMSRPLVNIEPMDPGIPPTWLEGRVAELDQGARVYGVQRNIRQWVLARLDMELADGQDPLQIARYARYMQAAGGYAFEGYALAIPPYEIYDPEWPTFQEAQPDARLLGLLHVGTVVSRHKLEDPDFLSLRILEDTYIYRNRAAQPLAFLVAPQLGEQLAAAGIDGLVEQVHAGRVVPDPAIGEARVIERGPNSLTVRLAAGQDGYLIVGNPWYPGWQATLNGHTTPMQLVGGVLQGVSIPAGTAEVTIRYRPDSVRHGLLLSLIGALLASAWALAAYRRHPRGR